MESTDADQSRILSLENAWNEAVQQKDTQAIQLLLAPELVYVDYDGNLMDRAAYLAGVKSQSVHSVQVASESIYVQIYGVAAVVRAGRAWPATRR
jgi:ketosteroid isomerase-like protein